MKAKNDPQPEPTTPQPPADPALPTKPPIGSLEDYERMEAEAEARAKSEGRETLIGLF